MKLSAAIFKIHLIQNKTASILSPQDLKERFKSVRKTITIQRGNRLIRAFLTLWEGKWLILGATLLAAVLGFAYITLTPNNFEAKLNIAPLSANDISDYSTLNSIVACDLESTAKTGMFTPRYHSDTLPFFEVT